MFCTVFVDTFQRRVHITTPFPNHAFSSEKNIKKTFASVAEFYSEN